SRAWDRLVDTPAMFPVAADYGFEDEGSVLSEIREDRRDLYALVEGDYGALSWEAGVRWENTAVRIDDLFVAAGEAEADYDYDALLPSASLKFDTAAGRVAASVARTMPRLRSEYRFAGTLPEQPGG